MPRNPLPSLTYLGRPTPAPTTPDEAVLDRVPNPHDDAPYVVRFSAPEFTVLCAVTGQPDFAHIVIDYVPKAYHSGFHEECTIDIGKRLAAVLEPAYLRIGGYCYPRGGMPIDVFWGTGVLPTNVWLPEQGIATYRGHG